MTRLWHWLAYLGYLLREILAGGLRIARSEMRPRLDVDPAVVEFSLRCSSDLEITLMASSITMTPGTLTLGIAPGSETRPASLFVHALYGRDPQEVLAGLTDMEDRLLRATRRAGRRP